MKFDLTEFKNIYRMKKKTKVNNKTVKQKKKVTGNHKTVAHTHVYFVCVCMF